MSLHIQEDSDKVIPLTWDGKCGTLENTQRIVITGGSSAGGIYQFKEEPESFFSTHLHNKLSFHRAGNRFIPLIMRIPIIIHSFHF